MHMKNQCTFTNNVAEDEKSSEAQVAHILFVDDEDFLVKLWKNILKKRGFKVTGYTNAQIALEDFKNNPHSFDIVVTDQTMPYITGSTLAVEFTRIRSDIKIILCTGYLGGFGRDTVASMGICEILIKPFSNNTLIKAIERNL